MTAVLIVEDEKHLANGLRYNLTAEGYAVDIAGTGEEAAQLLLERRKAYDVVVLDVMLPGMDGFTLASKLREKGHSQAGLPRRFCQESFRTSGSAR